MEGMAAGPKLMFVSLPKVFNSLGIVGIIIGYFILCIHRFFAEMLGLGVSVATSLKNIKTDTNIIAKK